MYYTQQQPAKQAPFKLIILTLAGVLLLGSLLVINNSHFQPTQKLLRVTPTATESHALFQQWKSTHNKHYKTSEEEYDRLKTFTENHNKILDHNSRNKGTVLALNKFADLTSEEFSAFYAGYNPEQVSGLHKSTTFSVLEDLELPSSVDWRKEGAVTPVKNQQHCGGCWAFAAAASLEGLNKIKNGKLVSLSEQQLIDCVTTCSGCQGCGNLYNALEYTSQHGIETESDYPFIQKKGSCRFDSGKVVVKNQGYAQVQANSPSQLKAALVNQPVLVGIEADQTIFQFYKSGVITHGCGNSLDHAVTAVGYGVFDGQEAFIVKNSWGPDWGVEGYVMISTTQKANNGTGVCGILSSPAYPTDV